MARCRVLVCDHLDQTISIHYGPHQLGRYDAAGHEGPAYAYRQYQYGQPVQAPYAQAAQDPYAQGGDQYGGQAPYAGQDPYAYQQGYGQPDPYAYQQDPYAYQQQGYDQNQQQAPQQQDYGQQSPAPAVLDETSLFDTTMISAEQLRQYEQGR